jgi:hypothetical protein
MLIAVILFAAAMVSYETSYDSKKLKLEPKLVSTLSETGGLFRLYRFNIKTAHFDVSIETKQTINEAKQAEKRKFVKNRTNLQIFLP